MRLGDSGTEPWGCRLRPSSRTTLALLIGLSLLGLTVGRGSASADVFRDLVSGDEATRAAAALEVISAPHEHSRGVLRRAINVASLVPDPRHLPKLTQLVKDGTLDSTTRAIAALAIGRIGSGRPGIWPPGQGNPAAHDPLPMFSKKALLRCVERDQPPMLRRACAEALGVGGVQEAANVLGPILADSTDDTAVRIFAARALTRLTGQAAVPADLLDHLSEIVQNGVAQ